ncbi:MAG: ATP phosphoribosyltransferase regulatory subunit [Alphaproteobacteria bacterium]
MNFLKNFFSKTSVVIPSDSPNTQQNYLLPSGFYDLLFDEARESHQKINIILDGFFQRNFQLIKTPLLEYEDSFFFTESYASNSKNYFRLIDNISGKSLILRNDITLQINRLLATRLKNVQLPLKLCYVGDVLHTANDQLYGDRQQTQVGCEIIGELSPTHDQQSAIFEIITSTIEALNKIGLSDLVINFSLPDFLEIFLNNYDANDSIKKQLKIAIINKDLTALKNLVTKDYDLFKKLTLHNDNLTKLSQEIKNICADQLLDKEIDKAKNIANFITNNFKNISLNFNLFDADPAQYHHNIAFDIFVKNFPYAIAKAGCYRINSLEQTNIPAVGATIYINHLRKIFKK